MVICSSENEDIAHMATAFDQYRLRMITHCAASKDIRKYLQTQFKVCSRLEGRLQNKILQFEPAAKVDKDK